MREKEKFEKRQVMGAEKTPEGRHLTRPSWKKTFRTTALGVLLAASLLAGCGAPAESSKVTTSSMINASSASVPESTPEASEEVAPTSAPAATALDPSWYVYKTEKGVQFLGGTFTKAKVDNQANALEAVREAFPLLGVSEETVLASMGEPLKIFDTSVYEFAEKRGGEVVDGSVIKLLVGGDGTVLAVNSALGGKVEEATEPISKEQAEEIVAKTYQKIAFETNVSEPLPILITEDGRESNENRIRSAYRVYTNNPGSQVLLGETPDAANAAEIEKYPYLIHYVSTAGKYLFYLPARDVVNGELKDQEYDHSAIFEMEGIEPVQVTYKPAEPWKGRQFEEMTLDLVKDSDGKYLLIDPARRIVMCDYKGYYAKTGGQPEFQVRGFESLEDVDQEMLVLWGNFARIYDFYKDVVGWKAPDGKGSDTMLLYYVVDQSGEPKDEALYEGSRTYGFDTFTFGKGFGDAYALDVMAHEYTHCLTRRSMTSNVYYNDQGAINEAMSDIIGYMIDMLTLKEDGGWVVGRYQKNPIRSFSDPELYKQPATMLGRYYTPNAFLPSLENDYGGVHCNSSLVNHIAYLLCEKGGMTYEEALRYWLTVDMSLTKETNFSQLSVILPYTLKVLGMEKYMDVLTEAMKKVSLTGFPEEVVPGTVLMDLKIDADTFKKYYEDEDISPISVLLLLYDKEKDAFESTILNVSGDGHFRLPVKAEKGETVKAAILLQHIGSLQALLFDKDKDVWRDVSDILYTEILTDDSEGQPREEKLEAKFDSYLLAVPEGNYASMDLTKGFAALAEHEANADAEATDDVSYYDLTLDEG